ncbi:anthranilate phosphoribosyltransferase [Deferribacter abyssi]|uniref:anthranilate phosphoribosyltransferase n=1 Tax=Deferribacter abyssi TaxID=213806 RepID=UPI003C139E35
MNEIIKKVYSGQKLTENEALLFFDSIMTGSLSDAQIGGALIAMKMRGESADEIFAAAKVLNKYKVRFEHSKQRCIDTCGTGGDGKSCVNVSSAVAIILSSMGYSVVKHGNVAISGRVGSANIYESFGIPVKMVLDEARRFFDNHNFVFLFAPNFHPAMKYVAPIRKDLMVPTIFNLLGPLVNPAEPEYQIIGVGDFSKLEIYAEAVTRFKNRKFIVYSSKDGYDEVSTKDMTICYKIVNGVVEHLTVNPEEFFEPFDMPCVRDEVEAKRLFLNGITGEDENVAKLFALNTALALHLLEDIDLKSGYLKAYEKIKSGECYNKMKMLSAVEV